MRPRDHLLISTVAGLALYGWRPRPLLALIAAGTLVDVDHLLRYVFVTGDWSVVGALRYERYRHQRWRQGDTRPRYGSMRSALHRPWLMVPALWMGATRYPWLQPLAYGLSLHLLLDHLDGPWRIAARLRARGRCEGCGRHDRPLQIHRLPRQGRPGFHAICKVCHRYGTLLPS
ncbi:MAG: hypothetical protein AB4911_23630 [Oscillochloridaceae bacterium umkhey_bin13]